MHSLDKVDPFLVLSTSRHRSIPTREVAMPVSKKDTTNVFHSRTKCTPKTTTRVLHVIAKLMASLSRSQLGCYACTQSGNNNSRSQEGKFLNTTNLNSTRGAQKDTRGGEITAISRTHGVASMTHTKYYGSSYSQS